MSPTPSRQIILASTSLYRRALMERLGVPFDCVAPGVDEDRWKGAGLAPVELASALARLKAQSVARERPEAIVIGSDQLVDFEGRVLGKPGGPDEAIAQLTAMAGRTHRLITALVVVAGDRQDFHTDVTMLTMRALAPAQIRRYIEADQPFDCAGSYKLEARGISLFSTITSADHSAITGLPLIALTTMLQRLGVVIP